jgi:hypothetical protein
MRQFGSIRKGCVDVFKSQGRIASENLVSRGALCQVIENHGDRNSGASGAKIASTNGGVAAQVLLPDRHATIVPPAGSHSEVSSQGSGLYGEAAGIGISLWESGSTFLRVPDHSEAASPTAGRAGQSRTYQERQRR